MRALAVLLLAAGIAFAGGLPAERRAELVRLFGGSEKWSELPRWRQEMIEANYADILRLKPAQQRKILSNPEALREKLLKPRRRMKRDELPAELRREIERVPRSVRGLAARIAMMRLRQLRLDRGLMRVPYEKRWPLFRRLFPEPFDQASAQKAYNELRQYLKRDLKAKLMRRLEEKGIDPAEHPDKVRKLFRQIAGTDEKQVIGKVRRELFPFQDASPRTIKSVLERRGYIIVERPGFATPRQKELIRYCLAPFECPLLDMRFMGPRPARGPERRAWERDYQYLARLDLLFEARLPREIVLHLAATGSPQDFLRALKALRRAPQGARKTPVGTQKDK